MGEKIRLKIIKKGGKPYRLTTIKEHISIIKEPDTHSGHFMLDMPFQASEPQKGWHWQSMKQSANSGIYL